MPNLSGKGLYSGPEFSRSFVDNQLSRIQTIEKFITFLTIFIPPLGVIAAGLLWTFGIPPSAIDITILGSLYLLTMLGTELGLHRYFAHRSFKAHPALEYALAILGSMAAQGPVIWWAATHRRHHGFTDRLGDPHSPYLYGRGLVNRLRGLVHSHTGWLVKQQHARPADWQSFGSYLYRERIAFHVHIHYLRWVALGLALPALLGGLASQSWMGGLTGFIWGGLVRVFLTHHFFWALNSISHSFGTRPFNTGIDQSRNNFLLALPTLGAGWHNNHHAFPGSAITQFKWWQIDLSAIVLKIFEFCGLAWDIQFPDARSREAKRANLAARNGSKSSVAIPDSQDSTDDDAEYRA